MPEAEAPFEDELGEAPSDNSDDEASAGGLSMVSEELAADGGIEDVPLQAAWCAHSLSRARHHILALRLICRLHLTASHAIHLQNHA